MSAARRRIGVEERRARLLVRHGLAAPRASCVAAARDLVGLHSTDPVSVLLAARARTVDLRPVDVERALYDERSLARILGMRRTMFVVPAEVVPIVHAACTRALVVRERARLVRMLEDAGVAADGCRWLRDTERATLEALAARGEATATELSTDVPQLRTRIAVGQGKRWEGTIGVSTRVLFLLATDARIIRGRPRGSWTSTQYRWAPLAAWLGVDVEALPTDAARSELARLWLRSFGPASVEDLRWWTGWTVADTRAALDGLDLAAVDLDGRDGLVLADDTEPVEPPAPSAALLPALDPTVMGWKERDWYLGNHRAPLFDSNGNAGPTIWWGGRIVGGWAQRRDGGVAVRLLEDVGAGAAAAIDEEAARLAGWLGSVRFVPRFRTPLERELAG